MLHTETVLPKTYDLLNRLMNDEKLHDFNLAGGTALSLQIGHRMNIGLTMFSSAHFSVDELKEHLVANYDNFQQFSTDNFTLTTSLEGVKVDFISYSYPLIKSIVEEDGIRLYSIDDISAMKLSAIGNNGTRLKDYIDVVCLSSYFSLYEMLENFDKKFPHYNNMHIVRSVGYHAKIKHIDIELIHYKYDWKATETRIFDMLSNPEKRYKSYPFSIV